MQKESYCRQGQHEDSKRHGKLRAKNNRLAWGIHCVTRAVIAAQPSTQRQKTPLKGSVIGTITITMHSALGFRIFVFASY